VGFEPRPEDSYGRCGSDKIRQTVPDASSGNRCIVKTGSGPNKIGTGKPVFSVRVME